MEIVQFDTEITAPALPLSDFVLRRGKVFEVGDYPDKGFSLTPEEAVAAVAAFTPCNADLEHKNTVLDNKIGGLIGVEMGADNKTIYGTVSEPKWLSDVLGNEPRKVSLTWDKGTKQIKGIAHVLNPRVSDAAVFGAYAAFSSQPPEPTQEKPTMKVFIPITGGSQMGTPEQVADFCGGAIGTDTRGLQVQHEDGRITRATPEEIVFFTSGKVSFAATTPALSPEIEAQLLELAQFKAAENEKALGAVASQAEAKFTALCDAKKVTPGEKEELVAAFTIALRYDAEKTGLAYFGADSEQAKFSLADYLTQLHEKRGADGLFENLPKPTAAFSNSQPNTGDANGVDQKARLAALQNSEAGRTALQSGAITIPAA